MSAVSTVYWTRSLGDVYAQRAVSLSQATSWLRTQSCSDSAYVWGHAPEIYYLSGLRPASRYISLPALMTEGWATSAHVEGVLDELIRRRPTAVIDASSWGGSFVTFSLLQEGGLSTHDGRYVDALDPIRDFVRARYTAAGDVAEWPAYALTSCGR